MIKLQQSLWSTCASITKFDTLHHQTLCAHIQKVKLKRISRRNWEKLCNSHDWSSKVVCELIKLQHFMIELMIECVHQLQKIIVCHQLLIMINKIFAHSSKNFLCDHHPKVVMHAINFFVITKFDDRSTTLIRSMLWSEIFCKLLITNFELINQKINSHHVQSLQTLRSTSDRSQVVIIMIICKLSEMSSRVVIMIIMIMMQSIAAL